MIVLITGASHTGKTMLAQRLLEDRSIPYLSVDHVKMGLIRSGYTALTPEDDNALTEYLWPVIREIVKTAVENRQDLIVEGCYVPFHWRRDLAARYLDELRFICLAMSDVYIDSHFDEIKAHASDIEARLDDSGLTAERLKAENRAVIHGFRASGEAVTFIENDWAATMVTLREEIGSAFPGCCSSAKAAGSIPMPPHTGCED